MENRITLIHGTYFLTRPKWVLPGKPLRTFLENNLGIKTTFEAFNWSGKNSQHRRIEAARLLALYLEEQITAYPHARKTVIAHSHGGNVAFYALKMLGDDAAHFKLVTLATPFLNVEKRELPKSTRSYIISLGFIILGIPAFTLLIIAAHFFCTNRHFNGSITIATMFIMAYLLLSFIAIKLRLRLKAKAQKLPEIIDHIITTFSLEGICELPLLVVYHTKDQVKRWIKRPKSSWDKVMDIYAKLFPSSCNCNRIIISGFILLIIGQLAIHNPPLWIIQLMAIIKPIMLYSFGCYVGIAASGLLLTAYLYGCKSNPFFLGLESLAQQMFIKTDITAEPEFYKNKGNLKLTQTERGIFFKNHGLHRFECIFPEVSAWIANVQPGQKIEAD
ncbi:esterase/lipase family protein [Mucilaginibacter sp. E4BP6]|uniref:esterase/lipase family protein n=1 Tax=Mucilaginibacter sp. E4BP6 TaxID=2723089 RepID=UPI0015CEDDDC|nr:hypothetical protein [Mucilaginibacter sp. E4BP6]NYE66617.1 hypothetical protein [Mucilaginibacter sp. E4BP6]